MITKSLPFVSFFVLLIPVLHASEYAFEQGSGAVNAQLQNQQYRSIAAYANGLGDGKVSQSANAAMENERDVSFELNFKGKGRSGFDAKAEQSRELSGQMQQSHTFSAAQERSINTATGILYYYDYPTAHQGSFAAPAGWFYPQPQAVIYATAALPAVSSNSTNNPAE